MSSNNENKKFTEIEKRKAWYRQGYQCACRSNPYIHCPSSGIMNHADYYQMHIYLLEPWLRGENTEEESLLMVCKNYGAR